MRAKNYAKGSIVAAALGVLATALIAGCATTTAQVRSAPGVNLASYSTFAFVSPLGTDRAGYTSFLSTSLQNATRSALEAKGYRYSESNPQLLVNFTGKSEQKTDVEPAMAAPMVGRGFYGYRAGLYGAWGGWSPMVDQYDEGTLLMDVVDASKKELLWEGTATLDKTDLSKWNDQDVQKTVQTIVDQIPAKS